MKGKILKVGTVEVLNGVKMAVGWHFDGLGEAIGMELKPDGTWLACGYTIEELEAIANGEQQP